jgi:hypothetical protein
MSSQQLQAKAQALNSKMEAEARGVLDEIERTEVRKVARKGVECVLKCYDKAGTTGAGDVLENCVSNCQMPSKQANQMVQQEVGEFQQRLNRSMMECQDKAKDMMYPGIENDAKKMGKVEETLLACMSKTVDNHIGLLQPLKKRIQGQLNQFK